MKVLLLKDVYKLGRAGEVKKVAAGYGRNYLIPKGLAMLATKGAAKMADRIKVTADRERSVLNEELSGIAGQIDGMVLRFPARASETGRLYGSINTRMLADAISEELDMEIKHGQIDAQPLRMLGEHTVNIRLTVDLVPEIKVIVHREGEAIEEKSEEAETEEVVEVDDMEEAEAEEVVEVEDTEVAEVAAEAETSEVAADVQADDEEEAEPVEEA